MPNVENQQRFVLVSIRKLQAYLAKMTPDRVAGCLFPLQQLFCGIRVKRHVLLDGGGADHVQTFQCSHKANIKSRKRYRRLAKTERCYFCLAMILSLIL